MGHVLVHDQQRLRPLEQDHRALVLPDQPERLPGLAREAHRAGRLRPVSDLRQLSGGSRVGAAVAGGKLGRPGGRLRRRGPFFPVVFPCRAGPPPRRRGPGLAQLSGARPGGRRHRSPQLAQRRRVLALGGFEPLAQRAADAAEQRRVAEPDLRLLRVNVDVDGLGRDVEEQEESGWPLSLHQVADRLVVDAQDGAVPQEPAVDEQEQAAALRRLPVADEAGDPLLPPCLGQRSQMLHEILAEQLRDPVEPTGRVDAGRLRPQQLPPRRLCIGSVAQDEGHVRPRQRVALNHGQRVAKLRPGPLQELLAGGHVVEQGFDRHRGAAGAAHGLVDGQPTAFDHQAMSVSGRPGGQELALRHGCNRRQGLSAKAQGRHLQQVLEGGDLAGRMAFECEGRVPGGDPAAVVGDRDEIAAAVLQFDLDAAGARVEGVLDKFLDHGRRPLHHLAGSDLGDQRVGKPLEAEGFRAGSGHQGAMSRRVRCITP